MKLRLNTRYTPIQLPCKLRAVAEEVVPRVLPARDIAREAAQHAAHALVGGDAGGAVPGVDLDLGGDFLEAREVTPIKPERPPTATPS